MTEYTATYQALRGFATDVFQRCGVPPEPSQTAAEVLCYADLHGIESHGIYNLERLYVPKLLEGQIDPQASAELIADTGATALMDGRNGLGLVNATRAIDLAIEKARAFGVGVVGVRRSSHCGSMGFYTARALAAEMVGLAMTNLGAQAIIRPPYGSLKMLGTNPICAGAPADELPPFLLDMSTTVVATGRVRSAARKGAAVPPGWLVDDAGQPVTDPAAYDQGWGHLLFLGGDPATGGFKGYGLALLVDVLCGVLTGASFGPRPELLGGVAVESNDLNIGHLFLVLNIGAFRPADEFRQALDQMLGALLGCPPAQPGHHVSYPGFPEAARSAASRRDGIAMDGDLVNSLQRLSRRFDIPPPVLIPAGATASAGRKE